MLLQVQWIVIITVCEVGSQLVRSLTTINQKVLGSVPGLVDG